MNINIAVCDDDIMTLKTIPGAVSGNFHYQKIETKIDLYQNGNKLLEKLSNNYDLFFLDIDMPEIDGIHLANKIKEVQKNATVVFVSGREERMYDAFSVQPFGFVRKSNFIEDISSVINLYLEKNSASKRKEFINLSAKGFIYSVNTGDIVYIVAYRDVKEIHLNNGKSLEVRYTMEELEKMLLEFGFYRLHKGYIINFKYVSRLNSNEVSLTNGVSLPVSRKKINDLKEKYLKYNRF